MLKEFHKLELYVRFVIVLFVAFSICCYTKFVTDTFLNHSDYNEIYNKELEKTPYSNNENMYDMDKFKFKDAHLSDLINPAETMIFYRNTEHSPLCCVHMYNVPEDIIDMNKSSIRTTGCSCLSKKQLLYLNTRGGNHLYEDLF